MKPTQAPATNGSAQPPWPWADSGTPAGNQPPTNTQEPTPGLDALRAAQAQARADQPPRADSDALSPRHQEPITPGHEAPLAPQAQPRANQPAPQPPRQWALPRLSKPQAITAALVVALPAAAIGMLLLIAHHHSTPAPAPPVITQVSGPVASTAPTVAPPSATIPLPTPPPPDSAEPSLALTTSQPAPSSAATQAGDVPDGAPPAVDAQPRHLRHHTIPMSSAPVPPAPHDSSPPPSSRDPQPSADQQWDKTTTCDDSGRCVDHYNPKPTPAGG